MQRSRAELLRSIEAVISRHAGARSPVPGLSLARLTEPLPATARDYEPSLCVCVRGAKRVTLGDHTFAFDSRSFFLASVGLLSVVSVEHASPRSPYIALEWRLDLEAARQIITEMEASGCHPMPTDDQAIVTGQLDEDLLDPLARLVRLLDAPHDICVLASLLQREILYRLLVGPRGARLREIAKLDARSQQVTVAVRFLREHFRRKLRVEELAHVAGMGTSTLHRHFHALTAMTPLQFQKRLRLQEARRLMLREQLDAAVAASRVGYESPAHFTHDYRRLFGRPPRQDITHLRARWAEDEPRRNAG